MSDFKIIGNSNPVVGVLEIYTVSDFFEKAPSNPFSDENSFSYNPVYWEVYVLELGKWRKTKENDKRGNKVSYTFLEKSLTRNGIRILARKGEKVARIDIKPLAAQPKIDHIELLDKNGAKINGRLSYGQTVKARVFCLNMEKRRISVTMWEDDVKGAGHNKANEKNFIETLSGIVRFGKADIDFLLKPGFAKIAERGGHEKDKIHEFYVTAEYNDGKIASNNINVNAIERPVAPYKGKTTPQQPVKNKPAEQKPNVSTAPKAVKGKINAVHITDTTGNQIKGKFREKQIKVLINSTGLTGKEVCLKLYDEDLVSNDLLFTQNLTIKSDLHTVTVPLDTIPRSLGGNNWAEGNEQELFAEIEVLQTHDFIKSAVVDVDATVFKQDPFEIFNKVLKVDMPDKKDHKEDEKDVCEYEARIRAFMRMLRIGEGTEGESGYTTAFDNNKITDLSSHPQKNYGGSTAAGAYQIMRYTWWWLNGEELDDDNLKTGIYIEKHDYIKKYKIPDYTQESQDKVCLIIMKHKRKGLIDLIISNQIEKAIRNIASLEWASLPHIDNNSKYKYKGKPQPATPMADCLKNYETFLKEELSNKQTWKLHLKNGFLKEFGYNCCDNEKDNNACSCGKTHYNNAKPENWVHQEPGECWAASVKILKNYGIEGGKRANCIIMANQKDKILNPTDAQIGIDYIDSQLKIGNPVVVGLDDNLRETTYNVHKATDHFFVIVGSGCEDDKRFYNFFDVGSKTREKGTDSSNKLTIKDNLLIQGKSNGGTHNYTITEIRRNN